MKTQDFFKLKERICRIYNGSPGIIKEPHEACPFQVAMKAAGIENDESCHDFIARNPDLAESIAMMWAKTYEIPKNRDVLIRSLQSVDCRYELHKNKIYHNGIYVAKLDKKWAKKKFKEI